MFGQFLGEIILGGCTNAIGNHISIIKTMYTRAIIYPYIYIYIFTYTRIFHCSPEQNGAVGQAACGSCVLNASPWQTSENWPNRPFFLGGRTFQLYCTTNNWTNFFPEPVQHCSTRNLLLLILWFSHAAWRLSPKPCGDQALHRGIENICVYLQKSPSMDPNPYHQLQTLKLHLALDANMAPFVECTVND